MTDAFGSWRKRRAAKRVKPGDGRALAPFRWWQLLTRSLMHLRLTGAEGRLVRYAIDVRHLGNAQTGAVEAQLFREGHQLSAATLPAVFTIEGGTIEVAASVFGLKRAHYVTESGTEQQLEADPRSAEGRRERLDHTHPKLSRWVGWMSLVVLILGLAVLIPQLLAQLSQIPWVEDSIGSFAAPFQLATWSNLVVTLATVVASTERALRLRYHWLLDGSVG
jgi:hypothetical protein